MRLQWKRVAPDEWSAGDYRIRRWHANDRGNRVRQYRAEYYVDLIGSDGLREVLDEGKPLEAAKWERWRIALHQEPFRELSEAQAACQRHADMLEAVEAEVQP